MNKRCEKGITLIALVITIIVMLILVGVTITIAVNGGLFNYAQKAAVETNEALEDEQTLGTGEVQIKGRSPDGNPTDINAVLDADYR